MKSRFGQLKTYLFICFAALRFVKIELISVISYVGPTGDASGALRFSAAHASTRAERAAPRIPRFFRPALILSLPFSNLHRPLISLSLPHALLSAGDAIPLPPPTTPLPLLLPSPTTPLPIPLSRPFPGGRRPILGGRRFDALPPMDAALPWWSAP